MISNRYQKVLAQVKREISLLMKDSLPEEMGIVSLSDVDITADFKEAKVLVSVLDEEKVTEVLKFLNDKALEFQRILGRKLKMKFTPKIVFIHDQYSKKVERVDELLKEIDHES